MNLNIVFIMHVFERERVRVYEKKRGRENEREGGERDKEKWKKACVCFETEPREKECLSQLLSQTEPHY